MQKIYYGNDGEDEVANGAGQVGCNDMAGYDHNNSLVESQRSSMGKKSVEQLARSHKKRVKPSSTYFIQEKNLLFWLGMLLLPFLICIIAAVCDRNIAIWLPSFSMAQCGTF